MRSPTLVPILACLLAAALFGASTPLAKLLLAEFGPFTLAGLLYLGAALAVAPFALRGGDRALRARPRERWLLGGAILSGGLLGPVLLLAGLRLAPAGTVALWLNLETVATTALAWACFREHVDRRSLAALGLMGFGGVLLAGPGGWTLVPALLLVALACVCWGLDNNWTALIGGFTPAQTTLAKGVVAGSANLAIGLAFERPGPAVHAAHGWAILALALAVGALAYGASIALYIRGAQQLGASRSQLLFSTAPFLGLVLSWLVLREPVLAAQLVAGGAMGVGVLLLAAVHHDHDHAHAALEHTHAHRHDDGHHDHAHAPGTAGDARREHVHPHRHGPLRHAHPHVPDLHHRHDHGPA